MWSHLKEKGIILPKTDWKEINARILPVLRKMEVVGIKLDVSLVKQINQKLEKKISELAKEIFRLADYEFNINSPSQMADVLFVRLKLPTTDLRKTKSGVSTAAGELAKIRDSHPIIAPVLQYRELSKLSSTYLKPLPLLIDENNRLHTHYAQDTSTGRLTSTDPNLQNIPIKGEWGNEIRKAFIADEGKVFVSADYSQIELRVVACLADDTSMIEAFRSGQDIHSKTACEIFNTKANKITSDQRRFAKVINFGILYGMSPFGLSQALGIDQSQASDYIKKYFEAHTGIKNYCDKIINFAHERGYVETLFGYTRTLSNINAHYRNLAEAEERMAINTPVQGSAAEILKLAMIELDQKIDQENKTMKNNEIKLLLTVHDELVVEAPANQAEKVAKMVKEAMESVVTLCVPIEAEVEIGKNWGEMEKIQL